MSAYIHRKNVHLHYITGVYIYIPINKQFFLENIIKHIFDDFENVLTNIIYFTVILYYILHIIIMSDGRCIVIID